MNDCVRQNQLRSNSQSGFTLIELVIVIVILGILTGIAVPTYVGMSNEAKESSAKGAVGSIRSAIGINYSKSALTTGGTPVYPAALDGTLFSSAKVPTNPVNSLATVQVWDGVAAADNATGWQYQSSTGKARLNSTGNDSGGAAWTTY